MKRPAAGPPVVNLRRAYFECRYGQLHVSTAFPSTGGFDDHMPLVCLHDGLHSSRAMAGFMAAMATDRSVYAPDLPGCGESDPPAARPAIAGYAAAVGDFLDSLRLRQVDVLGQQEGAAVAAELAILRPAGVRKLVFVGVPLYARAEPAAGGGPGSPLDGLATRFPPALHNGPNGGWPVGAAQDWPGEGRLPLVAQPVLVLRPRDDFWEPTLRAERLLRHAQRQDLGELDAGLFAVAAAAVALRVRTFLDR